MAQIVIKIEDYDNGSVGIRTLPDATTISSIAKEIAEGSISEKGEMSYVYAAKALSAIKQLSNAISLEKKSESPL